MKLILGLSLLLSSSVTLAHSITVSGISSGAYMAQQFHTAYSGTVSGVGIIAGGPYYCAKNNSFLALNNCMSTYAGAPRAADSVITAKYLEAYGLIDPLDNMKSAKVYVLAGSKDKTVLPKVVNTVAQLYDAWGVKAQNLNYVYMDVGHAFPTLSFGNDCSVASEPPFISNCNRDVAGEILSHLIGPLSPKIKANPSRLFKFNQLSFASTLEVTRLSMNTNGFAYIPEGCENPGAAGCPIHVAFHGCRQTTDDIQDAFITQTGYNDWAEANRIVILYPQTIKNALLGNPKGCWDWWGYTTPFYHTKNGLQIKTIAAIVNALYQGKLQLEKSREK